MKKILFLAMAAAALVSCSQNEEFENAGQKAEIKFAGVVKASTKATVIDNTNFNSFTVNGYVTAGDMAKDTQLSTGFIDNHDVTKSGNAWGKTTTDFYWPFNQKVQFFATSPKQTLDITTTAGYPTFSYTIAATSDKQEDLLVAKALNQTKETPGVADNGVVLTFNHALTQVNFSVKGEDENTYKVTSITISGVGNTGTYKFEDNTWKSVSGSNITYSYPLKEGLAVTGTTAIPAGADGAALMLMPQSMPTGIGTAKITVAYQVFKGDVPLSDVITADADLQSTTNWAPGKQLRYTLTLTNRGDKIILGVPKVEEWTTDQSKEQEENVKPEIPTV